MNSLFHLRNILHTLHVICSVQLFWVILNESQSNNNKNKLKLS